MSIRGKRQSKNLTQEQVATLMGVKRSTVTKWETGKSNPRTTQLTKLADILGCTTDELLRGGGE